MIKTFSIGLAGILLSLALMQPASAATLQVANKTAQPAFFTVIYRTHFCKDDLGVHVAPNQTVSLTPGLCTVKTVYASITTRPGFSLACLPHNRTGASLYTVTIDKDLKNCYVK